MPTVTTLYGTPTPLTLPAAVGGLATSATFVAGVETNEIDNTANLFVDALLQGYFTVGTTPTINTNIIVYVWGSDTSLGTTPLDTLDGTASAETITSAGLGRGFLKRAAVIEVDATTSDLDYAFGPVSVAALFDGRMPRFWGVFVAHNTGVNLHATAGNHVLQYTGIKYSIAA